VTDLLIADLQRDEGCRLKAYPDPLTHAEPYTIGYGHTGPEVHLGLAWTQAQADAVLVADVAHHDAMLFAALPWAARLDEVRQAVLRNMSFNLGVGRAPQRGQPGSGLLGFPRTLASIEARQFALAAEQMMQSAWARQVGARAQRLASMMETGHR
jgi:lysozyme